MIVVVEVVIAAAAAVVVGVVVVVVIVVVGGLNKDKKSYTYLCETGLFPYASRRFLYLCMNF